MKNGRCRLHGGLSTGAKTAEGIERIRRANTDGTRLAHKMKRSSSENFPVLQKIPARGSMTQTLKAQFRQGPSLDRGELSI
jgi:hypothetical protein